MQILPGRHGKWIPILDGVGGYVKLPFTGRDKAFTVEVLAEFFSIRDAWIVRQDSNFWYGRFFVRQLYNRIQVGVSNTAGGATYFDSYPQAYSINKRLHIVFTYRFQEGTSYMELYVNDVKTKEYSVEAEITPYAYDWIYLGCRVPDQRQFHGYILLFRYYSRILPRTDIHRLYLHAVNMYKTSVRNRLEVELLPKSSYENLDTWEDASGRGNNGTVYGAKWIAV